jgi:hypothetical protein
MWTVERDVLAHDRNFVWSVHGAYALTHAEQVMDSMAPHVDFGVALVEGEPYVRHFATCMTFHRVQEWNRLPVWSDLKHARLQARQESDHKPLMIYVRMNTLNSTVHQLVSRLIKQRHALNLCFVLQFFYWRKFDFDTPHRWTTLHSVSRYDVSKELIFAAQTQLHLTKKMLMNLRFDQCLVVHSSPNSTSSESTLHVSSDSTPSDSTLHVSSDSTPSDSTLHVSLMDSRDVYAATARIRQDARRGIGRAFHWSLDGTPVVLMPNWTQRYDAAHLTYMSHRRQEDLAPVIIVIADILGGGTDVARLVHAYVWSQPRKRLAEK